MQKISQQGESTTNRRSLPRPSLPRWFLNFFYRHFWTLDVLQLSYPLDDLKKCGPTHQASHNVQKRWYEIVKYFSNAPIMLFFLWSTGGKLLFFLWSSFCQQSKVKKWGVPTTGEKMTLSKMQAGLQKPLDDPGLKICARDIEPFPTSPPGH